MVIYKTTYTVTVLSEGAPPNPNMELSDVLQEIDNGDWIGEVEYTGSDVVPTEKVEAELIAIGNDGSFFDLN